MKIFADSASDLPKSFFEQNGVGLFPLRVHIGEQEFQDILTIDSKKVYEEIRNGQHPKTSQASPEDMLAAFEQLAQQGETGLYIAFSSELSGTHNTAVMVAEQVREEHPELQLTIIDTKCASLGYGLIVEEAVDMLHAGKSAQEIEEHTRFMAAHMEHLFTVEDLDYLARGGRVSRASAFVGGLLNIKPLLHVEDGKLIPLEKLRGRKKVMKRMLDVMAERGEKLDEQRIAISHGDDEAVALEMKQAIEERFNPKTVEVHLIGSVIAAHTGPGTLAVFFLNKAL
ncbi:DegV family protein [Planococcus lenghuensis]|uniref:Fatty acid-binding protein DegV n=1 Tax=Planococcus lenghuensis TaxID=2213202 RepID=A0A1Q2L1K8_9BACL|nr:DegV family protein [Planococcus lenghuensis]AQQ53927.1 fatty acid-binding protein DegV [Planococcus lenghuensis]